MIPSASQPENHPVAPDLPGEHLDGLLSVLEEMVVIHKQLLTVLQREKCLIIEGDPESLVACLNEKEETLVRLKGLEKSRQAEWERLQCPLQEDEQSWNLKRLIGVVREPYRSRLQSCHSHLDALTSSITDLNQMNGFLVEHALHQITSLLTLLKQMALMPSTYQANGLPSDSPPIGKINSRG